MEVFERDFKGVFIPKHVWLDKRLNMLDKGLLTEIDSLDNDKQGCYASNEYLAEFCQCSEKSISRSIQKLKELGYIRLESFNGRTRILKSNLSSLPRQNVQADWTKCPPSNIKNNIDDNNIYKKEICKEKDYSSDIDFLGTIPTLQEVKDFIALKQLPIDAEDFYNYYSSIGWTQNNSPIRNWQYKALQWGKREEMKNGLKDIATQNQPTFKQREYEGYKFGSIEVSDDEI